MKINNEIRISCTSEEKEKIKADAEKVRMTLKDYCLRILLNARVKVEITSR